MQNSWHIMLNYYNYCYDFIAILSIILSPDQLNVVVYVGLHFPLFFYDCIFLKYTGHTSEALPHQPIHKYPATNTMFQLHTHMYLPVFFLVENVSGCKLRKRLTNTLSRLEVTKLPQLTIPTITKRVMIKIASLSPFLNCPTNL